MLKVVDLPQPDGHQDGGLILVQPKINWRKPLHGTLASGGLVKTRPG